MPHSGRDISQAHGKEDKLSLDVERRHWLSHSNLEELLRVFRECGSTKEMSSTQFIALLESVAHVPKDKAKLFFSTFSVEKHTGIPAGHMVEEGWEETLHVDFRRFLLAAIGALEGQATESKLSLLFRLYDANGDGVMSEQELHTLVQHLNSFTWSKPATSIETMTARIWSKRSTNGTGSAKGLTSAEFETLAAIEPDLALVSTRDMFIVNHFAAHRRHDLPFASVNGCLIPDDRIIEGSPRDGGAMEWTYEHKNDLTLSALEVGLRKDLRKRVSEQGCTVIVQLLEGDLVKESASLCKANNFRCRWPSLEENPVLFSPGFIMSLLMVEDDSDASMFPTLPVAPLLETLSEVPGGDEGGGGGSSSKGSGGEDDEGDDSGTSEGGEGGGGAGGGGGDMSMSAWRRGGLEVQTKSGTNNSKRAQKRPADVYLGGEGAGGGAGGGDMPSAKTRRLSTGTPNSLGVWSGGKGKGLMHLNVPTPSMRRTPLMSPMGVRASSWKLASYTVKLNRHHGTVENFEMLWQKDMMQPSSKANSFCEDMHASAPHTPRSFLPETPTAGRASPFSLDSPRSRCGADSPNEPTSGPRSGQYVPFTRQRSELPFDVHSAPNQLIEALRFFEMPLPEKNKPAFSWGQQPTQQMEMLAKFIESVARDVRKLCLAEPRCVHIRAPCYILGDLHGNYQDLIAFEKALWRIGPALSPANFLLLGDYVDRGAHSVEVITYLLAQKLMCPGKFVLLRGNHETRLQNSFTGYNPCFKDSCVALFGPAEGHMVWEAVNCVFDTLPLAAVIDNSIFCVHGGIPPPTYLQQNEHAHSSSALVAEINKIPKDIPQPDPQQGGNTLAWDLMWNDPAPSATLQEGAVGKDGFGFNISRGTGHMFTAEALDAFLKSYGFSHLVRAHEVRKTGFQVQQHARMVTLFSSSGYCGACNEACCILACEGKMRFIRLEHSQQPKLGSLASRAAAASAVAAALQTGRQEEEAKVAAALAVRDGAPPRDVAVDRSGVSGLANLVGKAAVAHMEDSKRYESSSEEDVDREVKGSEAAKYAEAGNGAANLNFVAVRDEDEEEDDESEERWRGDAARSAGGEGSEETSGSDGSADEE